MKRKLILAIAAMTLCGGNRAWADVTVPDPVYFNDFETGDGTTAPSGLIIVGNGVFEDDSDPRFGKIFHNDPELTKAIRTNYLLLPSNLFSSFSETSEGITVAFWTNKKSAEDFYWTTLFSSYQSAPTEGTYDNSTTTGLINANSWDGFQLLCRSWARYNLYTGGGYCDFTDAQNTNETNNATSAWFDDGKWHHYTFTMNNSSF